MYMSAFQYNKKYLPFGHSAAILDDNVLDHINKMKFNLKDIMYDENITNEFLDCYLRWIKSTELNSIKGLENFKYKCYSNGTTEAFDKFYLKHKNRRFRCFRGEYLYHRLSWRNNHPNWLFADDACLEENDAVVISLPFANTGSKHKLHEAMLDICDEMNIPVMVDCCYLGISSGIDFNFNHDSIQEVVFSLSKTFPIAHTRIGMRLTREDDDDTLFVLNKNNYVNRLGPYIGKSLIENFGPDYIPTKYKKAQQIICKHFEIDCSDTVLFGISPKDKFIEYSRDEGSPDSEVNRLSFHKFLNRPFEELLNAKG